jgi:hypothetical protein
MGNFTSKHTWRVVMAFVLTVLSQWAHAQSGSFGSTFAHTGAEMAIYEQHNFVTGSGTINAGIIGSERQPVMGVYSFINPNGTWINASNTAFVDGYVRTYQPGPFTFPIGDNNRYRPAAVSASSSAAPTTAAYYGVDPGLATTSDLKGGTYGILPGGSAFPTTSKAVGVGTVDNREYWDIDGTTPARITLTWDANTPITSLVGTNLSNLIIVGWDGTQWVAIPSTVDAASLNQSISTSAFTGPGGTINAGSITTNAALVPSSFIVYTLASVCTVTQVMADVTSSTVCSGGQVAINYTTVAPGGQVQWTRRASDLSAEISGLGNIIDYPTATGTSPVSYTYTATSAESAGCSSNTVTTSVTVNPVPIVQSSACSQTICSGETGVISFTSTVGGTTINWLRVEDGLTGTGDISETFATAGTYTYKIWGFSPLPASCMSSDTITSAILVNACTVPCDLTLTASASQTAVCVGGSVTLSATVSPAGSYTYSWSGPNGFTSDQPNPTATNLQPGDGGGLFTVTVTDANGCTKTQTVSVNVQIPNVVVTSNSPQCAGNTLSFSATSGMTSYTWTGPNGFNSSDPNLSIPNATTAATGSYTLVVVDAQGCTASFVTSATIADQPSLTVTAAPSLTICSGASTTLTVSGNNGSPVTWSNSLGLSGSGNTISFAGLRNLSGQPQSVTFVVEATAGSCTDQEVVVITINPEPMVQVVPSAAIYCDIENVNMTATAVPSTATINWTRTPATPGTASGNNVGTVNINESLPAANYVYTFTATDVNGCSSDPVSTPVTVQQ